MASFAAAKPPDKSIPLLKKILTGTLPYNDKTFTYTIYPNPHNQDTEVKNKLIKIFGNRIQKDKECLGITEDIVREYIKNKQYTALIYVKNNDTDDSATGALQYWDWCEIGVKQLWISDLCRVNNSGGQSTISPIEVLFDTIEDFSKKYNITENYLMVEPNNSGTDILLRIYRKYGFEIDELCKLDDYIPMKKVIIKNNNNQLSNNNTRQNTTRKNKKR